MIIRGCARGINSAGYDWQSFPSEMRRSRWKYLFALVRMHDVRFTTWWNAINPRWLSKFAIARNGEMKRHARKITGDVCSTMFIVSAAINGDWDLIVLDQLFSCILSSMRARWKSHVLVTRSISATLIESTRNYFADYHSGIIDAIEIYSMLSQRVGFA